MAKPLLAIISDPFQTPVSPGDDVSNGETTKTVCRITIMRGTVEGKSFTCAPTEQAIAKALQDNKYEPVGPRVGNEQKIRITDPTGKIFAGCGIAALVMFILIIGGCTAIFAP